MEGIVYERLMGYIKRRKDLYADILANNAGNAEAIKAIMLELEHLVEYAELQEKIEVDKMAKENN